MICWTDALVEDMCNEIRDRVRAHHDVASAFALGLTCRREWLLFEHRYVPSIGHEASTNHIAAHAAAHGHLALTQWALQLYGKKPRDVVVCSAVAHGQVAILDWLVKAGRPRTAGAYADLVSVAARAGQLEALQWLTAHWSVPVPDLVRHLVQDAASVGCVDILAWIKMNSADGVFPREYVALAMHTAAQSGQLAALQWLYDNRGDIELGATCLYWAVTRQNKEMITWLRERGCCQHPDIVACAVASGDLAYVQYIVALGYSPLRSCALETAVNVGNLDVVRWLYETWHCELTATCLVVALIHEHAAIVDYLFAHQCPYDAWVLVRRAVQVGDVTIVRKLITPVDDGLFRQTHIQIDLVADAAGAGSLPVLQYLRDVCHFTWDGSAINKAFRGCHRDVLVWLLQNGCPLPGE